MNISAQQSYPESREFLEQYSPCMCIGEWQSFKGANYFGLNHETFQAMNFYVVVGGYEMNKIIDFNH